MDTSETYIKMSDHPKIQDLITDIDLDSHSFWWIVTIRKRCPKCGNYKDGTYCKDCRSKLIEEESGYIGNEESGYNQSIWLPRQDQIQEMTGFQLHNMTMVFTDFVYENKVYKNVFMVFTSMEQLWLAFYMYETHNLVWDGKKWIKK